MDFHSFASKVKDKYPEYNDIDDLVLTQKILDKYPEYRDNIDASDLTAIDNLASLNKRGPVQEIEALGTPMKAGGAGIADLATGKGLQQAATDVEKVNSGEKPETTAGKIGEFAGSLVTPAQIATQAALTGPLEAIGTKVTNLLKGWANDAASGAIGIIKSLAKGIGVEDLDSFGEFLLKPIKIGKHEFPAIVQPTSSTKDMLAAAKTANQAAGQVIGKISDEIDTALVDNPGAIDLKDMLENLDKLRLRVHDVAANLGEPIVKQFDKTIDDFLALVQTSTLEGGGDLFSKLRQLKTVLGELIYRNENVVPSKAALEGAYSAFASGLDKAAQKLSPISGAMFREANTVFDKTSTIISALTGKITSNAGKSFFSDIPALGAATVAAASRGGGVPGLIAGALGFGGAKVAEAYGPQAVASGLNAAAPLLGSALKGSIRTLPVIGSTIASALRNE